MDTFFLAASTWCNVQHCAVRLKDVRETLAHGHCKLQVTLSVKGKNCKLFEDLRRRPMLDAFFSHRISHLQQIHQESLGLFLGGVGFIHIHETCPKTLRRFSCLNPPNKVGAEVDCFLGVSLNHIFHQGLQRSFLQKLHVTTFTTGALELIVKHL